MRNIKTGEDFGRDLGEGAYVRPLCRRCIEQQYWLLRLVRSERLLVDGHVFAPQPSVGVPALCVVKGDATYFAIACAAIVAKVAHDSYVQALCDEYPMLDAWYDLRRNFGYGTAKHRQGLATHGATPFHRKTFGGCKGVRAAVGWEGVAAVEKEEDAADVSC